MDHRELSAAIGDAHKHTLLTNVSHGLGCRTVQPEKLGKKISEWAENNVMNTDATTGSIDFESLKALQMVLMAWLFPNNLKSNRKSADIWALSCEIRNILTFA